MSVPGARAYLRRPYLCDVEHDQLLERTSRGRFTSSRATAAVTETQAKAVICTEDLTVFSSMFGVYVADGLHKTHFFSWLSAETVWP